MAEIDLPKRPAPARHAAGGAVPPDTRRIRTVLGRSPHSRDLPGEVLDRLAGLGRIEHRSDGELIHAAWQPVRKLWLLLSGGLRVTEPAPNGDVFTTAVLGEGSYYAMGSLVADRMRVPSEAHAIGNTVLAAFELARLEREFGAHKGVEQHRRLLLYRRYRSMAHLRRDAIAAPLPQAVARCLLGLALAAGRGPDIELPMAQADLAAMLGASRSRINAELRRLETCGAVRAGYRRIIVRDLRPLRAAAGVEVMPI